MVSNDFNDEKPNLRSTNRFDINGKTLHMYYFARKSWHNSYICASVNTPTYKNYLKMLDKPGLLGIEQTDVYYSLSKKKRWKLLDDIQESHFERQNSSTSTLSQETYHIKIDSYLSERFRKRRNKPLSIKFTGKTSKSKEHTENPDDIIYFLDISTRKKQIPSVRVESYSHSKNMMYRNYDLLFCIFVLGHHCTLCRGYRPPKTFHFTKQMDDHNIDESSVDDDDDDEPLDLSYNSTYCAITSLISFRYVI